jgi:hypothetical protein
MELRTKSLFGGSIGAENKTKTGLIFHKKSNLKNLEYVLILFLKLKKMFPTRKLL